MSDIEKAEEAISVVYNDMDVDQIITKERMEELIGYIQDLIGGLDL